MLMYFNCILRQYSWRYVVHIASPIVPELAY
jgi:hypothetical protein